MHKPENERANDRELAALFAAAGDPPAEDTRFVGEVMKRIRRREQLRWLVLTGSAVLAAIATVPVFGALEAAWGGAELGLIGNFQPIVVQLTESLSTFVQTMGRYTTFLAAAALAAVAVRLFGLLED